MPLGILPPFVDPFSEVQARIEEILKADDTIGQYILPGNQVASDNDGVSDDIEATPKSITAPADYGEWRVIPTRGGGVLPRNTSSSSAFIQHFEIGLVTDDEDVKMQAFPLKFAVIRALIRATDADEGFGLPYVQLVTFQDTRESNNNPEYQRGIPGWTAIIVVSVTMSFKTADLVAEA